jgi:hypothetical protein
MVRRSRMSFCPECGLDFDEGMATCPDCQVELVEIFPQADQRDPFRDFTPIFLCYSMDDAILVQTLLQEQDIPCLLSDLRESSRGTAVSRNGNVRVMVPNDELERASSLIEEAILEGELESVSGESVV